MKNRSVCVRNVNDRVWSTKRVGSSARNSREMPIAVRTDRRVLDAMPSAILQINLQYAEQARWAQWLGGCSQVQGRLSAS